MAVFVNEARSRIASIKMYDENGVEWSNDFFDVGTCKHVIIEGEFQDIIINDIPDIDYAIEQAREWEAEDPDNNVVVVSDYL